MPRHSLAKRRHKAPSLRGRASRGTKRLLRNLARGRTKRRQQRLRGLARGRTMRR